MLILGTAEQCRAAATAMAVGVGVPFIRDINGSEEDYLRLPIYSVQ